MPAAKYDMYVEQGVSTSFQVQYKAPDATAKDLTGFTGKAFIKKQPWDTAHVAEMVVTVTDAVNGELSVTLPKDALDDFDFEERTLKDSYKAHYDVLISNETTGEAIRLVQGAIFISPGVTK